MRSLWKGLTPFAGNLTLKYFLRFGTNAFYQNLLRDAVRLQLDRWSSQHTQLLVTIFDLMRELPQ